MALWGEHGVLYVCFPAIAISILRKKVKILEPSRHLFLSLKELRCAFIYFISDVTARLMLWFCLPPSSPSSQGNEAIKNGSIGEGANGAVARGKKCQRNGEAKRTGTLAGGVYVCV